MPKSLVFDTPGLDPTLPDVVLRLGGIDRHLCFDFNAIVQAEKITGVNLLTAIIKDIDATNLRGLLWAALLKESHALTLEDVGALITPQNIGVIHSAIIAAWFGSVSDSSDESVTDPKPEAQAKKRKA